MKIEHQTFEGTDPNPKMELIAVGKLGSFATNPVYNSKELFLHTGPGANGYLITLEHSDIIKIGLR